MIDYRMPRRPYFAGPPPEAPPFAPAAPPRPNMDINIPELETPRPGFDPRLQPMHQQPQQMEPAPADDPDPPPPVRSVLKRQEAGPADTIRRMRLR